MGNGLERVGDALAETYRFERELGRGGMASVVLARDLRHDRQVAVKILDAELAATLGSDRFLREIRIAARLQHPHIVPLYDSGQAGGLLFYVMPFIEGESLRDRLQREGACAPKEAVQIAGEVADALAYAHRSGVVHRDIKPENVLISGGHALVADFGIARAISQAGRENLTQGLAIGTPAYMSPEQAAGDPDVDGRSDIYSLGCVLFEMLTGAPPFTGPTVQSLIAAHMVETAPSLPGNRTQGYPALRDTVARALAKRPADRFATATDFAEALTVAAVSTLRVSSDPASVRYVTPTRPDNSIAVLPFVNRSAEKDDEYFSDGMTEELIHALARLGALRVASRTSTFAFKGKSEDIRVIGEKLNVNTVLEGSVRRAGNQVRVTAQLVNAADGYHIWSETYQRKIEDIFAIQDEISRAIVEALKIRLGAGTVPALVKRYTDDVEAYKLYLQGRYWWNKRTEDGLTRATRFFQEAIARDSRYALAYAGLADAYALIGVGYGAMAPTEAFTRARDAALKALDIDDGLAEAHASLAFVAFRHDWDWDRAEQGFQRALQLDPSSVPTRHWYALYLAARRRFPEALAQLDRAQALDPLSLIIMTGRGRIYHFMEQTDTAIECFRKTLELDPNFPQAHFDLGLTLLMLQRFDEAITSLKRAVDLSAGRTLWLAVLGWAYGAAGRREQCADILRQLQESARHRHVSAYEVGLLYFGMGETERALDYFEEATRQRESLVLYLGVDPNIGSLRDHPRTRAILQQLNLT